MREEFLASGKFEIFARVILQRQQYLIPIETGNLSSIQLTQQFVLVTRNHIDQVLIQSLLLGKRARFRDCSFRELRIAPALFGKTAEEGRGVIVDFLAQDFVHGHRKPAGQEDRRRRSRSGSRRHRCDVR